MSRAIVRGMRELGTILIRAAGFCLLGAGAAVASIGIPLIEYAKEERLIRYEIEEKIGVEPSDDSCVPAIAKSNLGECKTSLYMQQVLPGTKAQLNRWIQILTLLGVVGFLLGVAAHLLGGRPGARPPSKATAAADPQSDSS